jgi:GTP-binding protein LepA
LTSLCSVDEVLQAVVDRLPSPRAACGESDGNLTARIIDSWYEEKRGMIMLVQIVSGSLREGQRIIAYASSREFADEFSKDVSVQEIGLLTPTSLRTRSLSVSLSPSLPLCLTLSLSLSCPLSLCL